MNSSICSSSAVLIAELGRSRSQIAIFTINLSVVFLHVVEHLVIGFTHKMLHIASIYYVSLLTCSLLMNLLITILKLPATVLPT